MDFEESKGLAVVTIAKLMHGREFRKRFPETERAWSVAQEIALAAVSVSDVLDESSAKASVEADQVNADEIARWIDWSAREPIPESMLPRHETRTKRRRRGRS